jgi:hypothetical protein
MLFKACSCWFSMLKLRAARYTVPGFSIAGKDQE